MKITTIQESDEILLSGIARADPVEVKKLYTDYWPSISGYIRNNSGTEEEARDIFQDAVMVVYKKLKNEDLHLEVPFGAWLLAVCKNMWLSRLRYKKGKRMQEVSEMLPDPGPGIPQQMENLQVEKVFYRHFENLGGNCREILRQFFNKVPMRDIALAFDSSESYIKKRKHHCKEQLLNAVRQDPLYKEWMK